MSHKLANILANGIEQLNLSVSTDIQQQLIQYLDLLHKWNKVYNLTSVRNKNDIVSIHLLDSLAILPHINAQKIIDVGTGAGLPGIVLALCFPEIQFVLIDSNSKKTRFIKQVVTELKIKNVLVEHCRIETLQCETSFDQIVSRAYTSLQTFIKSTCHLANSKTEYLAMKGQLPETEIREIADDYTINPVTLDVPNIEGQRHLIIMTSK
jgi:16S rRNA (guanine527-N7)-methyltransferase